MWHGTRLVCHIKSCALIAPPQPTCAKLYDATCPRFASRWLARVCRARVRVHAAGAYNLPLNGFRSVGVVYWLISGLFKIAGNLICVSILYFSASPSAPRHVRSQLEPTQKKSNKITSPQTIDVNCRQTAQIHINNCQSRSTTIHHWVKMGATSPTGVT